MCQRSSVRWSVWWKSSQNRASSQSAALRSSTCGGSTCCTLCGPTQANSQVLNTMLTLHMTLQEAEWGSVCSLYQHLWIQLKVWPWLLKSLLLFTLTEKNRTQCRVTTYFFLEKAVENEDKHSLEGVEYGEEVRHNNRGLADEEEPKRPGETEQTQQSKSTHDPGSEGRQTRHRTNPAWGRFCDRTVIGILITRFHYEICRKG